jgi:superfamily II DNA/RNA helicase
MSFSELRYLVADEADTLFDAGFGPELRRLVLSVKVRTHHFSSCISVGVGGRACVHVSVRMH